jgi:hypothetical protein
MLDDLRDHDPHPTEEEEGWMSVQPLGAIARTVALAAIALVVAWTTSLTLEDAGRQPVAMFGPR